MACHIVIVWNPDGAARDGGGAAYQRRFFNNQNRQALINCADGRHERTSARADHYHIKLRFRFQGDFARINHGENLSVRQDCVQRNISPAQ